MSLDTVAFSDIRPLVDDEEGNRSRAKKKGKRGRALALRIPASEYAQTITRHQ